MNLNHLRAFRCVYEQSSISEAARLLKMTQPPLSRMLRAYEGDVGVKLFTRNSGRLVPTPEADQLYQEVVGVLDDLDKLARTTGRLRAGHSERLAISASVGLIEPILAPVLVQFRAQYPGIPIDVDAGALQLQRLALERGDIDMVLTFDAPPSPHVRVLDVGVSTFVAILSVDHPLASEATVDVNALEQGSLLQGIRGSPLSVDLGDGRNDEETSGEPADITTWSVVAAMSLTAAGLGVILIDRLSAAAFPRDDVVVRPLSQPTSHNLQVLMRAQHKLSAPQEYLLDEIRSQVTRATGAD